MIFREFSGGGVLEGILQLKILLKKRSSNTFGVLSGLTQLIIVLIAINLIRYIFKNSPWNCTDNTERSNVQELNVDRMLLTQHEVVDQFRI